MNIIFKQLALLITVSITMSKLQLNTYQNPLSISGKALRDSLVGFLSIDNEQNYIAYQYMFLVPASCECNVIYDEQVCLAPFCQWTSGLCENTKFKSENSENYFTNYSKMLDFEFNLKIISESSILKLNNCGSVSAITQDCLPKVINKGGQYQICNPPSTTYKLNAYDDKPKVPINSVECIAENINIQICSDIKYKSICQGPCIWLNNECALFNDCTQITIADQNSAFSTCWKSFTDAEEKSHQCLYNSFNSKCGEMLLTPSCSYFTTKNECMQNLLFNKKNNWIACYWSQTKSKCFDCTGFVYSGNF